MGRVVVTTLARQIAELNFDVDEFTRCGIFLYEVSGERYMETGSGGR